MALKQYIIKQITNWNAKGERAGTHTVQMDEGDISTYISFLDGKVVVFEENLTLSVDASTATTSIDTAEMIILKHSGIHKPIYISNGNKRPIVLKSNAGVVEEALKAVKPFSAPYTADMPVDTVIKTGNVNLL